VSTTPRTNDPTSLPDGFFALGDPTRRAIFERLAASPCSVTEIAAELPVSRPAVSQHLKILKEAGLVRHTQQGRHNIYQINPGGDRSMRAYLDRFWDDALAAFKRAVETSEDEP
jgi:DNA-binding transcriptional ArsR family regulator